MGDLLNQRRAYAARRVSELRTALDGSEQLCTGKACVYTTGSFGRGEAGDHSDLDLFIVSLATDDEPPRSKLGRLDEILIKADLIECTRNQTFPEFSGDGEYLVRHSVHQLVDSLGKRNDDAENTFTARLLLLLESQPLLGNEAYKEVTDNVIAAYWRDYTDHKGDFIPAFLANDILRLWRTLCVNYEAGTFTEPDEEKAKRKLKNFKLKHSRLLTCYSALLFLLYVYESEKTVSPGKAREMVELTPTQRLEFLLRQKSLAPVHDKLSLLIGQYESFLTASNQPKSALIAQFLDKEQGRKLLHEASRFGNLVFDVLGEMGKSSRFHRLLVV
jgi:hypothetical protein